MPSALCQLIKHGRPMCVSTPFPYATDREGDKALGQMQTIYLRQRFRSAMQMWFSHLTQYRLRQSRRQ